MKILIAGSGAKEYTLAKVLKDEGHNVFVAPGNDAMAEFVEVVDIKANDVEGLCKFVKNNAIDLTVGASEQSIIYGIVEIFNAQGMSVFAPDKDAAQIAISKSYGKKFMYKNKIPTPRFGIFDKESAAIDYIRNNKLPVAIKLDNHINGENTTICHTFSQAKKVIEKAFNNFVKKIVIEEFIEGAEVSLYVITDGYNQLLLPPVKTYKYSLDGNGGLIGSGFGAYAPLGIDKNLENFIVTRIVRPTLTSLNTNNNPYIGILGLDLIIDKSNRVYTLEYNSFLQEPDAQCIFSLVKENWADLFNACIVGSFSDDYQNLNIENASSASIVLTCGNYPLGYKKGEIITGLEKADDIEIAHFSTIKNVYGEFETNYGRVLALTSTAATLSRAVETLYENTDTIKFNTKKFRKDIGKVPVLEVFE